MDGAPTTLIIPLIASLSLDTFAVSLAIGIAPLTRSLRLRFVASCVLAESVMPLLGFALGGLVGRLGSLVNWISVATLLGVGLWMLREALQDADEVAEAVERVVLGGAAIPLVALSVSLDELAIGLAFGTLRLPVRVVVAAIAMQALFASMLGMRLGVSVGARVGQRAGLAAALVLCGVGSWLAIVKVL